MKNRVQEAIKLASKTEAGMVVPGSAHSHLGGSITGNDIGDPASYYPNMWTWAVHMLGVKSVIDIGCGQGYSLEYFAGLGCRVKGIEGFELSIKNGRRPDLVTRHDYEKNGPLKLDEIYDMAWCCEFVEHVEADKMDNFFATFKCARVIFMTHALPGQGGHHHVNEQLPGYWVDAFKARGFRLDADLTNCARLVAQADHFLVSPQMDPYFVRTGMVFINDA